MEESKWTCPSGKAGLEGEACRPYLEILQAQESRLNMSEGNRTLRQLEGGRPLVFVLFCFGLILFFL